MKKEKSGKTFWKKHRWDFLLLIALVALSSTFFVFKINRDFSSDEEVIASIYVGNSLQKSINLTDISEYKEEEIVGLKGKLTLGMNHNEIAVIHSSCPGQECVHEGYIRSSNHPIVCAYNQTLITLKVGASIPSEVPIG